MPLTNSQNVMSNIADCGSEFPSDFYGLCRQSWTLCSGRWSVASRNDLSGQFLWGKRMIKRCRLMESLLHTYYTVMEISFLCDEFSYYPIEFQSNSIRIIKCFRNSILTYVIGRAHLHSFQPSRLSYHILSCTI